MGLASLPNRLGSSSVIVVGISCVVAVFISILAMSAGFRHTLADTTRPDRAIVLRGGSDAELNSSLSRSDTDTIANAPGIRVGSDGQALLSREIVTVVNVPKIDTGTPSNITFRGVGLQNAEIRPELKIVKGRMFRPAVRELIAGVGAAAQFQGLEPGDKLKFRNAEWTVSGTFATNGDVHESELLADTDTVASSIERAGYSSALVLLKSPADFQAFKDSLTSNPQLSVEVQTEKGYYAKQSESLTTTLNVIGTLVAVIMAIGATFGALNCMYSAVVIRAKELATLRAIGFRPVPVLFSVLTEGLLLSLLGGALGALFAWVVFNGNSVSTLGGAFAQVVFKLRVTPALVVEGIIMACVIGFLGGLFPALRIVRLPVSQALRNA
jgi:putative ABC transport system permease protein